MHFIENRTFEEIHVGDTAQVTRPLGADDAATSLSGASAISELILTELPGPGTTYLDLSLHINATAAAGDVVTTRIRVRDMVPETRQVTLSCECSAASGEILMHGQARVIAPQSKIRQPRGLPAAALPVAGGHYRRLLDAARQFDPIRTAVVHPCDVVSLASAIGAMEAKLIVPVLVGPIAKIRKAAAEAGRELHGIEIHDVPHSHAAGEHAVALGHEGKVDALMKGALHTDELMAAVIDKIGGLRTERRMSHVFALDVPHHAKPLFITDAAVNIAPDLECKRDIIQNALDLAHALGIKLPKVAILSATETVSGKIPSTIDAAALCKMSERGQIQGGVLDGPLAFDNAISSEAARTKGIVSAVAGDVDILLVPDLEAGNMLVKQLIYLAGAQAAGIVLGARLPIILTSRADSEVARLASCALAALWVRRRRP